MTYEHFIKEIYNRHSTNVKLGLDRMYNILSCMGNPEKKLRGIHIAGTNGKGSTSAMCERLLIAHNHTVGLNTSPHLIDYTERFRINGEYISPETLVDIYHANYQFFEKEEASFFEITTALAFKHFSDLNLDSTVFEVGLGGRLDGTNPFNATVSVITSISIDHPKSLGDTVEKIAFEKAGIIKKNVPVVIGNIAKAALDVILNQAQKVEAPYYLINKDFFIENLSISKSMTRFDYSFPKLNVKINEVELNLLGKHQAHNAALAITAFLLYCNYIKFSYSTDTVRKSLSAVNWMGRMQVLSKKPFIIIDGAHNEEGIESLVDNLKIMLPNHKYNFVVSILRDKKLDKMIEEICSIANAIYISKNSSERAADIQEQVDVAIRCNIKYYTTETIIESVKKCLSSINDETDAMIITGSLYTIAEVLKYRNELF